MRQFLQLVMLLWLTVVSPAQADFLETTKPSKIQRMFPRGELFFACTSTGALFKFLEQGKTAVLNFESNDAACGTAPMTAVTRREDYVTSDGRRYQIYRFLINGWDYYTYNQSGRRWRRN